GLDEEGRHAGPAVDRIHRVEEESEADRDALGQAASSSQAVCQLADPLPRRQVAGRQEELVLAREVGVDRADRQAALSDDVLDGGPVEAELAEDLECGNADPGADLLLVGDADTGHDRADSSSTTGTLAP